MRQGIKCFVLAACLAALPLLATTALSPALAGDGGKTAVQLGPRPFYLVDQMDESRLKRKLQRCAKGKFHQTDFSIGHRGAPLQFPEHTKEAYQAGARMGAGILECDVTFTSDLELVCRHDQCDLHTTTNILATPLAAQCTTGFTPAEFDPVTGARTARAGATCCASDITLAEFKTLEGKMDASDPSALTVAEFLGGTADFRTDLYATGATLLTHAESIALFAELGAKYTPELKAARVAMPFNGFSQQDYAQKMIDEYKAAGISPRDVFAQSFFLDDVLYWIDNEPAFGRQAVFLDGRSVPDLAANPPTLAEFRELHDRGVNIIAPPIPVLVALDGDNKIVPSVYAGRATAGGLDIITWSLERSGRIVEDVLEGGGTFYYQTILDGISNDGDILVTLDVLAQDVGIIGIFSDWPATVTYYANCMGLDGAGRGGDDDHDD